MKTYCIPTKRSSATRWAAAVIVLFVAACVAALLSGCNEGRPEVVGADTIDVSGFGASVLVRDVTTKSGVHCVVMFGSSRGGISCDWEHAPH